MWYDRYFIGRDVYGGWVEAMNEKDDDVYFDRTGQNRTEPLKIDLYAKSFYFVFTTMTTVGYGAHRARH